MPLDCIQQTGISKKLSPGQPGTKRYLRQFGDALVCVRYRMHPESSTLCGKNACLSALEAYMRGNPCLILITRRMAEMKIRCLLSVAALFSIIQPVLADGWFYGHPAPTVSAEVAYKDWQGCVTEAVGRLDDHISSVMDIAKAIEPLCSAKEDVMIDAINMEFLDKKPGIAVNMSLTAMEQTRREAHEHFRQTIGTLVLTHRANTK